MKLRRALPLAVVAAAQLLVLACARSEGPSAGASRPEAAAIPLIAYPELRYPETATVDQVDDYHGTEVADPYRWLEEDVRESDRVRSWVEAENAVTFAYLESIPERQGIFDRLKELWDYEKYGVPEKKGGRYYYELNDGLQNQDVVYVQASLDAEPELLVDPNEWSEDGTVALSGFYPSPDGRWVAFLIQDGGSDWRQVRILDLASREEIPDELDWLKFTDLSWTPDGVGFYYSRYPEPEKGVEFQTLNRNHTVYYHRVGTPQAEDRVAYASPEHPDWGFSAEVTDDGAYLVITTWIGTDNRYQIAYRDLRTGGEPVLLVEGFEHDYTFVGNDGQVLFFRTDDDAPKGRLIGIDVAHPERSAWREVVPEGEHVLRWANRVGDRLVAGYLRDARSEIRIHGLDGTAIRTVELPGIGSAVGFDGVAGDPETFFEFSSFATPPTIYRYDVASGASEPFRRAEVDFDPADYVVEQAFFSSKDGTRVPMFVSHRKGVERNGAAPTLLYGYGGFDIPLTPKFAIDRLAWMEMGGVYAVANLRGGGEYGEPWHRAGTKLRKQNVFDDFIAAGESLIEEGWTQPARLAVIGRSNGGLLSGAVTNQRPDLFGAALPGVGVMDMLRFHRFTAGRFWVDDYGSSDDPDEFRALYAYSPYHNLLGVRKRFPAVLVTTADTDDRVVPGHSFKYVAALQKAQAGPAPVLIRIETRAGHGSGKPTDKQIEEAADSWAFLVENLGFELPEDYGGGS